MTGPLDDVSLHLVEDWEELQRFMTWLGERRRVLGVDTETTGLDHWRDDIRLVQFGDTKTGWAFSWADWAGVAKHVFSRYTEPLVMHNAPFDSSMFAKYGISMPWERLHDTMPMCHLHDALGPKQLKSAATKYVDPRSAAGERTMKVGMKKAGWDWRTVPLTWEPYWAYGALDPVLTALLAEKLWGQVQYARAAYDLEMATERALFEMTMKGIRSDQAYCREQMAVLSAELAVVEAEIHSIWPSLNPGSDQQVIELMQGDGIMFLVYTEKGNISLNKDVLAYLTANPEYPDRQSHPLAPLLLRWRSLDKLTGTYFGNMIEMADDDLLHPHIHPLGAVTGRMSTSAPSLQNLPRSALVRDAFIPREGNKLILADYQAQELRMMANLCGDEHLIEAFLTQPDVHAYTAGIIYQTAEISKAQRRVAKQSGYAKIYGAGIPTFAVSAGISLPEAEAFITGYDAQFPRVPAFMQEVINTVAMRAVGGRGFVITDAGRRVPVWKSKAYVAVNYRIQGGCADVTKQAIVNAVNLGIGEFIVLPVHDELVFDVPEDLVQDVIPVIHQAMERHDMGRVPLIIETDVVDRWGDHYREDESQVAA
jgi:DNA polymerase-1